MTKSTLDEHHPDQWNGYRNRYRAGQWRAPIIHDMVMADVRRAGPGATILDIGCGDGFDGDEPLRRTIAEAAGRFIGVEPDPAVPLGDYFSDTHRCPFEEAPIPAASIDLAYSVMVLEHLADPQIFWNKLHEVLREGGVFWGLTVDSRHLFSKLSRWTGLLGVKNLYLDLVLGRSGDSNRYKNYPTHYLSNSPREIARLARAFRSCESINFSRVGEWGGYLPRLFQPLAAHLDRRAIRAAKPGTLLIVRVVR